MAIYNDVIIDIKLPLVIYKKILGKPCLLEDLKEIDEVLYNNFIFLLNTTEPNLEDILGSSFEVEVENFGSREVVELKPGGAEILISQSNKHEYVELYCDWYFNKSIEKFYRPFHTGFYRVADDKIFHIIDPSELELIICGTQELDFNQLKEGCVIGDGYTETSPTIVFFWEVVLEFDLSLKKKFLFFLTGCDRSPIKGLSSLKMVISKHGSDPDKLPCAHTCFNYLLLPDYNDKIKLKERLLLAIENSEGFGLI